MDLTAERVRQFRGLLYHYARLEKQWEKMPWMERANRTSRALVGTMNLGKGKRGICRWCQRSTEPRKTWHTPCVEAYIVAGGRTDLFQKSVIEYAPCPCGADATEVDHVIPLMLAKARGDRRGILRAYTLDNLQWLCQDCHRKKTAVDVRRIANVKAGRPEDSEPESKGPKPKPPPAGAPLF